MRYDISKITILIPCKNEAEGLISIIGEARRYASRILVIDAHSGDGTKEIVEREGVEYIADDGKGRGDAVRKGLSLVKTDIAVLFDADGSHEAHDIPRLVLPLLEDKTDMVIASRRTGGSLDIALTFDGLVRLVGSDLITYIVNRVLHTHFTDVIYSFRAIQTSVVRGLSLTADDHALEQEMVIACIQKGLRVTEIPSREKARKWGKSKLKTIAGVGLLLQLVKQLFIR